jgi:hypothetical protein
MANKITLPKRLMIDKTNQMIVVVMAIAAFVAVFSLVASKTLISQATYQNRIISAKKTAVNQLNGDLLAVQQLNGSYQTFIAKNPNVIGGNPSGSGQNDGNNANIVLDALPDIYNFPALATSLQKVLSSQGVSVSSITGTDQELTEGNVNLSATPAPIAMPFSVTVTGSYPAIQSVIKQFQLSIRPFQIQTIALSGNDSNMSMTLTAQTFFQPGKNFTVTSEVVK